MSTQSHTHTHLLYIPCPHLTTLPFCFSFSHFSLPHTALEKKKKSQCEDDNRGRDQEFKVPSHHPRSAQAGAAGYPPSSALIGCSAPTSRDEGLRHGTAIQRRPKRRGPGKKVQTQRATGDSHPDLRPSLFFRTNSCLLL